MEFSNMYVHCTLWRNSNALGLYSYWRGEWNDYQPEYCLPSVCTAFLHLLQDSSGQNLYLLVTNSKAFQLKLTQNCFIVRHYISFRQCQYVYVIIKNISRPIQMLMSNFQRRNRFRNKGITEDSLWVLNDMYLLFMGQHIVYCCAVNICESFLPFSSCTFYTYLMVEIRVFILCHLFFS
jgi:hypothetical protein